MESTLKLHCPACGQHMEIEGAASAAFQITCVNCGASVTHQGVPEQQDSSVAPSPHVASLRRAGQTIHRTFMGLGIVVVLWCLVTGIMERRDIHAEEHGYMLWAFIIAIGLAVWHRLAPPLVNALLDFLDRR